MSWRGFDNYGWRPYVPVGKKLENAEKYAAAAAKKQGRPTSPVKPDGKKLGTTFWGKAWCENLIAYSDYANRLPRGATYVRNGSVVDLIVKPRTVEAIVAGSETYTIKIEIASLAKATWMAIKRDCSASIDSLLDLLAGRFSDGVMQRLTRTKDGLFPSPSEIKMRCSCPDYSDCCKHLAAVMYGIGVRLDKQPELLFLLRDVDHQELVSQAVAAGNLEKELSAGIDDSLAGQDLGAIFGIELDSTFGTAQQPAASIARRRVNVAPTSKPKAKLPGTNRTKKANQKLAKKVRLSAGASQPEKSKTTAKAATAPKLAKKKSSATSKAGKKSTVAVQRPGAKKAPAKRAIRKIA